MEQDPVTHGNFRTFPSADPSLSRSARLTQNGPDPRPPLGFFRRWDQRFPPTPDHFNQSQRQTTRAGGRPLDPIQAPEVLHGGRMWIWLLSSVNRKLDRASSCPRSIVSADRAAPVWTASQVHTCCRSRMPRSTGAWQVVFPHVTVQWRGGGPAPSLLQDSLQNCPFAASVAPSPFLFRFVFFSLSLPSSSYFFHHPILHIPPKVIHAHWKCLC